MARNDSSQDYNSKIDLDSEPFDLDTTLGGGITTDFSNAILPGVVIRARRSDLSTSIRINFNKSSPVGRDDIFEMILRRSIKLFYY